MSTVHENLKWTVISDWTAQKRGRLYCMNQGLAFPARCVNGNMVPSDTPLWFGPLKRKFKGFPDTFGFELVDGTPVFCTVEVKTKNDDLSPDQKAVTSYLVSQGVHCYLAKETDDGYKLTRFEK